MFKSVIVYSHVVSQCSVGLSVEPSPLEDMVAGCWGSGRHAFDNWDRLFGMNGAFQLDWEVGVPVSSSNWSAPWCRYSYLARWPRSSKPVLQTTANLRWLLELSTRPTTLLRASLFSELFYWTSNFRSNTALRLISSYSDQNTQQSLFPCLPHVCLFVSHLPVSALYVWSLLLITAAERDLLLNVSQLVWVSSCLILCTFGSHESSAWLTYILHNAPCHPGPPPPWGRTLRLTR